MRVAHLLEADINTIIGWSNAINSSAGMGRWPPQIKRFRWHKEIPPFLKWWQRPLWRLLRHRIQQYIELAESIAAMGVIEGIFGKKEILRHHNCISVWFGMHKPNMTEEEFEKWWADERLHSLPGLVSVQSV